MLIKEWFLEEPSTGDRHWFYFYSDGTFEILTMRNNQK